MEKGRERNRKVRCPLRELSYQKDCFAVLLVQRPRRLHRGYHTSSSAVIAQLVERRTRNAKVVGSNPTDGSDM